MRKHFNRRNFIITIVLDLSVGALAGILIVNVVSPILGYVPAFVICGGAGVIIGMIIAVFFPSYTYSEEH